MTEHSDVPSESTNGYIPQKNGIRHVPRKRPGKTFILRNALLTDLFEDPNFRIIHSIVVANFWLFLSYTLLYDYVVEDDVFKGVSFFFALFTKFYYTILIWLGLNAVAWAWYALFNWWANLRLTLLPKSNSTTYLDTISLASLFTFYVGSVYVMSIMLVSISFSWLSRSILIYEQFRILMKIHAFVMYNKNAVIAYQPYEDKKLKLPKFSQFLYFMFAPTLLYRHEYVRTKEIRVKFLISCCQEALICFIFGLTLYGRLVNPMFQDYGLRTYSRGEIMLGIIKASWPAALGLLLVYHLLLHTSQNFFAECLRFGDRQYYKNWWASHSMLEYFKKWNVVVYDFLMEHVYMEIAKVTGRRGKVYGKLGSFLLSGVVHEVIMSCVFNAFMPTMSIQLITSGLLSLTSITMGNITFWLSMILGCGTLFNAYFMEAWARINLPPAGDGGSLDFFKPRVFYCDGCVG